MSPSERSDGSPSYRQASPEKPDLRRTEYENRCGCKYYVGQHPPIEFCPLHAQAPAMRDVIVKYHDTGLLHHLGPDLVPCQVCALLREIEGQP